MIKFGKINIKNTKKNIEETVEVSIENGKIVSVSDNNKILDSIVELNDDYEISVEDIYVNDKKTTKKSIENEKVIETINNEYRNLVEKILLQTNKYKQDIENNKLSNYKNLIEELDSKFEKKLKDKAKLTPLLEIEKYRPSKKQSNFYLKGKTISQAGFTVKEVIASLALIGTGFLISMGVNAATTAASNVSFDQSKSSIGATVQAGLDQLYTIEQNIANIQTLSTTAHFSMISGIYWDSTNKELRARMICMSCDDVPVSTKNYTCYSAGNSMYGSAWITAITSSANTNCKFVYFASGGNACAKLTNNSNSPYCCAESSGMRCGVYGTTCTFAKGTGKFKCSG